MGIMRLGMIFLSSLLGCSLAYSENWDNDAAEITMGGQVISTNTTYTQPVTGVGASGEVHSATIDQNGQWHAPVMGQDNLSSQPTVPPNAWVEGQLKPAEPVKESTTVNTSTHTVTQMPMPSQKPAPSQTQSKLPY